MFLFDVNELNTVLQPRCGASLWKIGVQSCHIWVSNVSRTGPKINSGPAQKKLGMFCGEFFSIYDSS